MWKRPLSGHVWKTANENNVLISSLEVSNLRKFLLFIGFVIAMALFAINLKDITPAHSAPETKLDVYQDKKLVKSVVFAIGVNKFYVDGMPNGVTMDARPFIQEGRTFVPIRFLSNALGVEDRNILWDGSVKKVTLVAWNRVEMAVDDKVISAVTVKNQKLNIDSKIKSALIDGGPIYR